MLFIRFCLLVALAVVLSICTLNAQPDTLITKVCPSDTLVLIMSVKDSSSTKWYYRWERSADNGKSWQIISAPQTPRLVIPPHPQADYIYQSKAAKTMFCLEDSLCEGLQTLFIPYIVTKPAYDFTIQHATCGEKNGSIDLDVYIGKEVLYPRWNLPSSNEDLHHLAAGKYYLLIQDQYGCITRDTAEVRAISSHPHVAFKTMNAHCSPNSGEISVVNLSDKALSFYWEDGSESPDRKNMEAGSYMLKIVQADECVLDTSVTISSIPSPILITPEITHATCDKSNASIQLHIQGNSAPYDVLWKHGEKGAKLTNLSHGIYSATITDKYGCKEETGNIEVVAISSFSVHLKVEPLLCKGASTATISSNLSHKRNYSFLWNNGATTPILSNLPSGKYSVTVTDNLTQCQITAETFVVEPQGLSVKIAASYDPPTYNLDLDVSGGFKPYVFSLQDSIFQDTPHFEGLYDGEYDLFIIDNDGCVTREQITIGEGDIHIQTQGKPHPPIFAPNIITPNGDERSDAFTILSPELKDAEIRIFSKDGKAIFVGNQTENQWRGSSEGTLCLEGVYFYNAKLIYNNGEVFETRGSVKLVR